MNIIVGVHDVTLQQAQPSQRDRATRSLLSVERDGIGIAGFNVPLDTL